MRSEFKHVHVVEFQFNIIFRHFVLRYNALLRSAETS